MEKIAYLLRINPDPEGTLEVDGERFRVYEEIDPELEYAFRAEKFREKQIEGFIGSLRKTKAEGDPKRNLELIIKYNPPENIS